MKRRKSGFTIAELLTVLGIIAVLVGLLVPALSMVRRTAKETQQKAQLTTIDLALIAFKNDYGDYPLSSLDAPDYCGAQKLAEALLGWDLLGFHPDSDWMSDGNDLTGTKFIYNTALPNNLNERRGPYLNLATTNAFKLGYLFNNPTPLAADPFVLCDSFGVKKVAVGGKIVKAGTPILYYRANTSQKTIDLIYNYNDNSPLIDLGKMIDTSRFHPFTVDPAKFYDSDVGIRDPKIEAIPWPYRPDSYILITAGADGLYGTSDDIRNFGN